MSTVRVPSLQEIAFANIFQHDIKHFSKEGVQTIDHLMSNVFRKNINWTVCCLIEDHPKSPSLSTTESGTPSWLQEDEEPCDILAYVYKPYRLWNDFKEGDIVVKKVFNILTRTSTSRALELGFRSFYQNLVWPMASSEEVSATMKELLEMERQLWYQADRLTSQEDYLTWEERCNECLKSLEEHSQAKRPRLSIGIQQSLIAHGAPNMMGKKNGCLKLIKDANLEMIIVHCVIHKENLVAKNISSVLNEVLHAIIKCVNAIKASAKCERLFKLFCEEQNEDHVRLILHTEVSDFLSDKPEMKYLLTIDGKAFVSYLADIFEKLNILNKQLQEPNKRLVDAKAKIFGFITNIELYQKYINNKNFEQFHWLQKCEVTDTAVLVIVNHLNILSADLKERFSDLKQIDLSTWMMQPILVDLSNISNMQYQEEFAELQNDESVKTLFNIKGAMAWLCEETEIKYPNATKCARKLLLPFPSSYLAECGFSAVNDLLIKKRNRLDITQRGDLRLKLSKLEPNIKSLCSKHQAQGSH
ncbi:SCAN domain-containing protein 3-like [Hylaeus volcanicus]|uniref:SCAN domain-containing protein 3-like n=1 Tax=Hylaeus volcanicus TaxID=313075 RepID=UPI0023B806ED|nr:SCAN domain-containing protein 3-like [Hylaeus volcanicus]